MICDFYNLLYFMILGSIFQILGIWIMQVAASGIETYTVFPCISLFGQTKVVNGIFIFDTHIQEGFIIFTQSKTLDWYTGK